MSLQTRVVFQLALYGGVIGGGLILLGLASIGGAGYVAMNPPVEEIPGEEVDVQQFETEVGHSAIVTEQTPLYGLGEDLQNMPVYFVNVTPELTLSIQTTVPDDRPVTVTHELVLRHVATFNEQEFWSEERVLIDEESTVETGSHQTNVTIDVREVQSDIGDSRSAIAGVGSISTTLQLETTYRAEAQEDGTYEGTLSATAPFELGQPAYWVDGSLSDSRTHSRETSPTVRQLEPDWALVAALGGLGILSTVLGSGILVWRTRRADVQALENDVVRSRYNEWISAGEFPTGKGNQYIYITSLEDLVDVGIDSNKRVIYDENLDTYCVVDGDLVYYHATDPTTVGSWLGLSGDRS